MWKLVGLLLPSTALILDFAVSLSTLPALALNDIWQDYDFVMTIMGDFSTTEKLPKNHDVSNIPKKHEDETVNKILI